MTESSMDQLAYRIGELVRRGPIGRTKLYELINSGALRARKCGKVTIITHDDFVRCLDALPRVKPKAPTADPPVTTDAESVAQNDNADRIEKSPKGPRHRRVS